MDRQEHPKPGFFREDWINLNGTWKYVFDFGLSGRDRELYKDTSSFLGDINIPFCPESELSGVNYKDFISGIWYTRDFAVPEEWKGDRVFIHFGGVDYKAFVYVNGEFAGSHTGAVSFSFDITEYLKDGINRLVVFAEDGKEKKPRGKQSDRYYRYGCLYTRVTGIWQTVWLERRPCAYIENVKTVSDFDNSAFSVIPTFRNIKHGDRFRVTVKGDGKEFTKEVYAQNGVPVSLEIEDFVPWCPENPFLYDVVYELKSDRTDRVVSYMGMRKVHTEGNKYFLNNKEIFLRFVLDQGYYEKGIWTAPCDEDLKNDILLALKAGFNGARLHQKVFEERFLYHADRLGYLVWAEHPDWGFSFNDWDAIYQTQVHFLEEMTRDYNHPSIIGWTPYNETAFSIVRTLNNMNTDLENHNLAVKGMADMVRSFDPTRPVNDTSGMTHVDTDIYTIHDYEQDPEKLKEKYRDIREGIIYEDKSFLPSMKYSGQPFVIDEYGGPCWAPETDEKDTWGYSSVNDIEEVYGKIENLTKAIAENPKMAGFCYTQLYDVEQEKNGIYKYDRSEKFDMKRIRSYFSCPRKKQ